ncbi:MAG: hypothetical protein AAF628_12145 [Planctomycetota bacterium]
MITRHTTYRALLAALVIGGGAAAITAQKATFIHARGLAALPAGTRTIEAEAGAPDGNQDVTYSTTPVEYGASEVALGDGGPGIVEVWMRNGSGGAGGTRGVEWTEFTPAPSPLHDTALVQLTGDGNDGWADFWIRYPSGQEDRVGSVYGKSLGAYWVLIRAPRPFASIIVAQRGGTAASDHVAVDYAAFPGSDAFSCRSCSPGPAPVQAGATGPVGLQPPGSGSQLDLFVTQAPPFSQAVFLLGVTQLQPGLPVPLSCIEVCVVPLVQLQMAIDGSGCGQLSLPELSDPRYAGLTFTFQWVGLGPALTFWGSDAMEITVQP